MIEPKKLLKPALLGLALALAAYLVLVAGRSHVRNQELEAQVRELTALVQQLTDARAADEAVMAERSRRLLEIDHDARKKQERLDEASHADSDADFLDALRRMFAAPDVPDK